MRNRNFTVSLLILGLIVIMLAPGCSKDTPEEVVVKFMKASSTADTDEMKKYCSKSLGNMMDLAAQMQDSLPAPDGAGDPDAWDDMVDMFNSSIDGDTAKVWVEDFEWSWYELKKEDGNWVVSGFGMDESKMMEVMEDLKDQYGF